MENFGSLLLRVRFWFESADLDSIQYYCAPLVTTRSYSIEPVYQMHIALHCIAHAYTNTRFQSSWIPFQSQFKHVIKN